jgi:hypothetical protein
MAAIITLIVIAALAALLYLKSNLVHSAVFVLIAVTANIVAFGYYEAIANLIISRGNKGMMETLSPWAQTISMLVLFALVFVILQTIAAKLLKNPGNLGLWPERIGKPLCGVFLGLIVAGIVLTSLGLAPLADNMPYQRFDPKNPNPEKPNKAALNADGFTAGWFSIVSKGSLSGKRSFATLHADFLDQTHLNNLYAKDKIPSYTTSNAISIPVKAACWEAPEKLKSSSSESISQKTGHSLYIVRFGFQRSALAEASPFSMAQVRIICKPKSTGDALLGTGQPAYPIGYMAADDTVTLRDLDYEVRLVSGKFEGSIDFVFNVPSGTIPVLAQFRNSAATISSPVTGEQVPEIIPFDDGGPDEKENDSKRNDSDNDAEEEF